MIYRCAVIMLCLVALACQSAVRYRAQRRNDTTVIRQKTLNDLHRFVASWLGTPYRLGGNSREGIDCSGFTYLAYQQCYNKEIPRVSKDQYRQGRRVEMSRLQEGDLIFFNNIRYGAIDHVAIYLGDDQFAHATESEGIAISSLNEDYYREHYFGACRY